MLHVILVLVHDVNWEFDFGEALDWEFDFGNTINWVFSFGDALDWEFDFGKNSLSLSTALNREFDYCKKIWISVMT
jgi:hypothetical protein